MGTTSIKNAHVKVTPSIMQKMKNTARVSPKFMSEETFFENKKRYFGTFIFVKMLAFARSDPIPPFVESVKKENTIFPQKR